MYYFTVPNIQFTDINGNQNTIKNMREFPIYTLNMSILLNSNDMLDEISSRQEIYGDGGEILSYKLFEANIAALVDNQFNLIKLKKLGIPV